MFVEILRILIMKYRERDTALKFYITIL